MFFHFAEKGLDLEIPRGVGKELCDFGKTPLPPSQQTNQTNKKRTRSYKENNPEGLKWEITKTSQIPLQHHRKIYNYMGHHALNSFISQFVSDKQSSLEPC